MQLTQEHLLYQQIYSTKPSGCTLHAG